MIKRLLASFVFLVLMGVNGLAQDQVLGRPTHQLRFFNHTTLDSKGNVVMASAPQVVEWPAFADELILELKGGAGQTPLRSSDPTKDLASQVGVLQRALQAGVIRDVTPFSLQLAQQSYGFTTEDLASQKAAGLDRFYSVKFNTVNEAEFLRWAKEFEKEISDPNSKIMSVTPSPVFKVLDEPYNDPLAPGQWSLNTISKRAADSFVSREGLSHVYVMVLDTGVDFTHEDIDLSKNFLDYDVAAGRDGGPDDYGHGTHVYTTICAATNNKKGIVGLAYGAWCGNIKTLTNGFGTFEMIAGAILVAASKAREIKAKDPDAQFVVNMSLGGPGRYPVIDAAVKAAQDAGVIITAAAGNSRTNIDQVPFTPASSPGVIAVAATDQEDKLASFSNYGPKTVLIAAPGVGILAGVPKGGVSLSDPSGYIAISGTSMADPHAVSGIALILSVRKTTLEQMRFLLFANTDDVPKLVDRVFSGGRLNLAMGLDTPKEPPDTAYDFVSFGLHHSSAYLAWTSPGDKTGKPTFGARVFLSEKEFDEGTLGGKDVKVVDVFAKKWWGEQINFLLPSLDEKKTFYAAVELIDRGANISRPTNVIRFTTLASRPLALRTFESGDTPDPGQWGVLPGPLAPTIETYYGENKLLWHLSDRYAFSKPFAWRYGNEDTLDYATEDPADSMIVSEIFDARFTLGLSLRFNKFQQMAGGATSRDVAEVYIQPLDESNRGDLVLLKRFSQSENSRNQVEQSFFDLSPYEGKRFRLVFRFFSSSSGAGIGFVLDDVETRVDLF